MQLYTYTLLSIIDFLILLATGKVLVIYIVLSQK